MDNLRINVECDMSTEDLLQNMVEAGMTQGQLAEFIIKNEHWFLDGISEDVFNRMRSMFID